MERPILFSGPMVKAILEGRKSMTRRVVKPKYQPFIDNLLKNFLGGEWGNRPLPYKKGDRLWVKETHLPDPPINGDWDYYMFNDGDGRLNLNAIPERYRNSEYVIYRASWTGIDLRWRPSIFMPRWASRITLEITNIRVERLQSITAMDAVSEGIERSNAVGVRDRAIDEVTMFRDLWDSINGKTYPWSSNPFVWVVEFKRVH